MINSSVETIHLTGEQALSMTSARQQTIFKYLISRTNKKKTKTGDYTWLELNLDLNIGFRRSIPPQPPETNDSGSSELVLKSISSKKHNWWTARMSSPEAVRTFTTRTKSSFPGKSIDYFSCYPFSSG